MSRKITLSKSTFVKVATKCELSGYLLFNRPDLREVATGHNKAIMESGTRVGLIAQNLFRDGVDISKGGRIWGGEQILETRKMLATENNIFYEAGFETPDGLHNCRVDMLVRMRGITKIIEVKSSTSFKMPEHLYDIAYQYWVLKQSGYEGKLEAHICYLNKEYVAGEHLDIDELFVIENVTQRVINCQPLIERKLAEFYKTVYKKTAPAVTMGGHCTKPYPCEFFNHCRKKLPEFSVFDIGSLRKSKAQKLLEQGITEPNQIPKNEKLNQEQWVEVQAAIEKKPTVKKKQILNVLKDFKLNENVFFIDFESFMPPIPIYKGTRPYQHLCFQFCVIYKPKNSAEFQVREFLAAHDKDPRRAFIENFLKATEGEGSLIVYNESFERPRLHELALEFEDLAEEIEERINRIKDLMVPFEKRYYYSPLQRGKYSIKVVLPILVPDMSYKNLEIQDGEMAMEAFKDLGSMQPDEQIITRRNLKKYCEQDVRAMIEIIGALHKLCEN